MVGLLAILRHLSRCAEKHSACVVVSFASRPRRAAHDPRRWMSTTESSRLAGDIVDF